MPWQPCRQVLLFAIFLGRTLLTRFKNSTNYWRFRICDRFTRFVLQILQMYSSHFSQICKSSTRPRGQLSVLDLSPDSVGHSAKENANDEDTPDKDADHNEDIVSLGTGDDLVVEILDSVERSNHHRHLVHLHSLLHLNSSFVNSFRTTSS